MVPSPSRTVGFDEFPKTINMIKTDYTREELISICEQSVVPYPKWINRDSPSSQAKVGMAWAYLKAGCEFRIHEDTGEDIIWLELYHYEFEDAPDWHYTYLPTPKRIEESNGKDWY